MYFNLRQNKQCNSTDTHTKRGVLVHTPSGFQKFEGISQEFKKKLFEWEKSQGIAPEYSTLQLLDLSQRHSAFDIRPSSRKFYTCIHIVLNIVTFLKAKIFSTCLFVGKENSINLKRSKSLSNFVLDSSLPEKTFIRQLSSLSLNDVTNLANEGTHRPLLLIAFSYIRA